MVWSKLTKINKSNLSNNLVTRTRLSLSQSSHYFKVLSAIKNFFGSGFLYPNEKFFLSLYKAKLYSDNSFYYNFSPQTFVEFFDNYPMLTRKYLDYLD